MFSQWNILLHIFTQLALIFMKLPKIFFQSMVVEEPSPGAVMPADARHPCPWPQVTTVCEISWPSSGSPKIKPCQPYKRSFLPSDSLIMEFSSCPNSSHWIKGQLQQGGQLLPGWKALCQQLLNDIFCLQLCHVMPRFCRLVALQDLMPITFSSPRSQPEVVHFLISNESPYFSSIGKSKISASSFV